MESVCKKSRSKRFFVTGMMLLSILAIASTALADEKWWRGTVFMPYFPATQTWWWTQTGVENKAGASASFVAAPTRDTAAATTYVSVVTTNDSGASNCGVYWYRGTTNLGFFLMSKTVGSYTYHYYNGTINTITGDTIAVGCTIPDQAVIQQLYIKE